MHSMYPELSPDLYHHTYQYESPSAPGSTITANKLESASTAGPIQPQRIQEGMPGPVIMHTENLAAGLILRQVQAAVTNLVGYYLLLTAYYYYYYLLTY